MSESPLALVTGASRGIGAATARALQPHYRLLLGGRDAEALEKQAADLPGATAWPVELTDFAALREAVAGIERLDVLVHSAGVAQLGTVEETDAESWRRHFEVNVVAVAELTRLLLPALRAAHGHVVVINSGSGMNAKASWGAYAASKFAARAFADTLRLEEEPNGVRVTSVFPGRTATGMQEAVTAAEGLEYHPEQYLRPESVAAAVLGAVTATPDAHPTEVVVRPRRR
ncbi:NADP-dependent 3-hydroxy acid dehydrogenase YdfG [Amycolatopsis bartoniae]|uniref:Short chain dehydrogenase n=1 Tax=Amycolatopsis bartoniae TaxID=941986 RepID=A0A8H9IXN8_9PSEU|nr:SDR family oxidoreductase [Amycolatopsis bartoniae]MBB2933159.1 NADP-dependent 3-hydroxy acid dehydrogenase YdfG [Amycolatopsis bartoniae]TVT11850.1 SDR family oxidoreductase [Amycolatopsis bartoniae]GHF57503.1 short chain dehydrogenase [Amycolatopsis bartoniae]